MTAETGQGPADVAGTTISAERVDVDVLFIPVFGPDDQLDDLSGVDEATGGALSRARAAGEFRSELYDVFVASVTGNWTAARLAFIGAGDRADADSVRLRRVASAAGYAARKMSTRSLGLVVRGVSDPATTAQTFADGLCTAEFEGERYKATETARPWRPLVVRVVAAGENAPVIDEAVRRGRVIGESANVGRDFANEPGNILPPRVFAERALRAATAVGLQAEELDEAKIAELDMGLLQGVARGSAEPPRLLVLRHEPAEAPATPFLGLVGKGVTFDTGGISLKPADAMDRMKYDMSGGAAVVGAMLAIARLACPYRVVGIIPMAENMPGGKAIRPGDVLRSASGRTVEITNTDAEGRLILADALWFAGRLGATHVVDVATLTGACVTALGRSTSGLLGNDDEWVGAVQACAARAGDRVWRLPIYEEAKSQLASDIADLVNAAGREGGGGTVTAAAFLREFAGDRPWAHLDIAGTAWADKAAPYQAKGPTGAAVRLLTELAMTGGNSRSVRTD